MFFYLSKILIYLLQPLILIMICLFAAVISKTRKWRLRLLISSMLMIAFFGNEFLINEIFLAWESKPQSFDSYQETYDVAIILGGVVMTEQLPADRTHYIKGVDRVLHPVYLYKAGKVKNFLVTGGTGRLLQNTPKEASFIKNTLLLAGVAEEHILIEDQSKNTYENALFSKTILDSAFDSGKYLLVSSAFHLPRAKACFDKLEIKTDILSTDFYAFPRSYTPDVLFIPSVYAILKWQIILKEIIGMIAYKIMGYA